MSPCSGWGQRSSASRVEIGAGAQVDLGLVVEGQAAAVEGGPQVLHEVEPVGAVVEGRLVDVEGGSGPPWPGTWPRRRSASARWPSSACSGARAMPMLAPTWRLALLDLERAVRSRSVMRSATAVANSTSAPVSRMANSSPPSRATRSLGPGDARPAGGRSAGAARRRSGGRRSR